jgi:hypothetical protein
MMDNLAMDSLGCSTTKFEMGKSAIVGDIDKSKWRDMRNTILRPEGKKERAITWSGREIGTHALYPGFTLSTHRTRFIKSLVETPDLEHEREERITFKEITCGDQTIKLKTPIMAEAILSEKRCSLYYEPLDILVSAPTLDECKKDFHEEFSVLYQVYAKEVDEKLTEGAKQLKRNILSLCR